METRGTLPSAADLRILVTDLSPWTTVTLLIMTMTTK